MTQLHELTPQQAYTLLQTTPHSLLIDIRSTMEYLFVGHPVGAVHIAWIDEPDWDINPNFIPEVHNAIQGRYKDCDPQQDAQVILICRSGKRSRAAILILPPSI